MAPHPPSTVPLRPPRHHPHHPRGRRVATVGAVALTAATLLLSACTGGGDPVPGPTSGPATSSTSKPPGDVATSADGSAPPAPPAPSGGARLSGGPVLAAKIDNTGASRPRIGVGRADVVYVEPVEAGLTRLLAVWSSSMPPAIGPVRSGRETDVDLLANYGPVAFAFSGGSAGTLATLARGHQVNLSNDASGVGFSRSGSRRAPYNVIGDPRALLARAGGSVRPGDPGFRYGAAPAGGARGTDVRTSWSASRIELRYDTARHRYLVLTDGRADVDADGSQHSAASVVVQHVPTTLSANTDVNGVRTPLASVVGRGAVDVLRDGRVWHGTWSRASAAAPTSFASGGTALTLATGPVWVLLVPVGQAVTFG